MLTGCSSNAPATPTSVTLTGSSDTESPAKSVFKPSETVTYVRDLTMDVFKPAPADALHLAVVLIHGGGWAGGDKTQMNEIGYYLAQKGFVAASIDYRLAPISVWPAELLDAQSAVQYIRAHAKDLDINPDKIGAAGISAGGHLAMFLGTVDSWIPESKPASSSRVQAVGSISGIHDLNMPLTTAGDKFQIVELLLSETGKPDKKKRGAASPINYTDAKTAPTFFIQGMADPVVPASQTVVATKRLESLKVPTEAMYVDGMGHGLDPTRPAQKQALDKLANWFKKYLK